MRNVWIIVLAGFAVCAQAQSVMDLGRQQPESWRDMDLDAFNTRIDQGVTDGATWPTSALRTTLELLGDDTDTRTVIIREEKNRTEGADRIHVQYLQEGLLDDAIGGAWFDLVYQRQPDRTWRLSAGRTAYRCYRVEDTAVYRAELCP